MNTNQVTRIGIMSQEKIRERVLNIAKGSYKPEANEPKIWFTSMRSLAEVLRDGNCALFHEVSPHKSLKSEILEIGRYCSSLPVLDDRSPDDILGYDERGMPN